jgi:hypothetical protein
MSLPLKRCALYTYVVRPSIQVQVSLPDPIVPQHVAIPNMSTPRVFEGKLAIITGASRSMLCHKFILPIHHNVTVYQQWITD